MKKTILLISSVFAFSFTFAQKSNDDNGKTDPIKCTEFHITKPLTELFAEHPYDENKVYRKAESEDREHNVPQKFPFTVDKNGPAYGNDPNTIQKKMGDIFLEKRQS